MSGIDENRGDAGKTGPAGSTGPQGPAGPAGASGKPTLVSKALAADVTVTSSAYADIMNVVVTITDTSSVVLLTFTGMIDPTSSTNPCSTILAYKVDSGSDVPVNKMAAGLLGTDGDGAFAFPVTGLSAGSHTIALRASAVDNAHGFLFNGTDGNGPVCRWQAMIWG